MRDGLSDGRGFLRSPKGLCYEKAVIPSIFRQVPRPLVPGKRRHKKTRPEGRVVHA